MQPRKEKLEAWVKRHREFQKGGLSRRAYCEKTGIKESTLDYWFSRIQKHKKNHGFIEVRPTPVQTSNAGIAVTVGRYRIEINDSAGLALLCETVRVIEGLK